MKKILIPYNSIVHSIYTDEQIVTMIGKINSVFKEQQVVIDLLIPKDVYKKIENDILRMYQFRYVYVLYTVVDILEYKQYINKICKVAIDEQYNYIFIPSGICSKVISASLSASLQTGVTVDVINIYFTENNILTYVRATSSRELLAYIQCSGSPEVSTFKLMKNSEYEIENISQRIKGKSFIVKEIACDENKCCSKVYYDNRIETINKADIIIGVGRGVTNDTLKMIRKFAERYHISVMATKPYVENGEFEFEQQIGQSGCSINSKLYIAIGISGAMQHVVGILGCEYIIAINPDKNAPIHDFADVSIISNAEDIFLNCDKEEFVWMN